MYNVEQIKQRINCVDYAAIINLPIRKSGDRCVSPRPGAKNPTSFVVYEDFFYDFGTGQGGDVVDLSALVKHDGNKGEAIKELAAITGVSNDIDTSNWIAYTQNLCNEIQHYHKQLTAADFEYLHKRGINDETITRLKLGRTDDGRLCIPYWKNNYIAYYATRYMNGGAYPDSKYKKMKIDDFNENVPWGLQTLTRNRELLVIAEGAFDVMSFEQENYACLSAITGHFSKNQLPEVISAAKSFKQVFLIFDNDIVSHAGEKFTVKMAKILFAHQIPFIVGSTPPRFKDVSDYYAAGNDLQSLIDNAVPGVNFLGSIITDEKEFEDFARKSCRYMSKPSVDMFFNEIRKTSDFDSDWLKTLCKDCKSAPTDKFIALEVVKQHKLLYNEKISFFEFNGKYWQARTDTAIAAYIDKSLGIYTTGAKISSILKIIKSNVNTDEVFNTKPIINFINGTLELQPDIKFREHSPDDLCTYSLPYPYDPHASYKAWDTFISEVTNEDERKMSLLQELSGYVLYPDNRLQKAAVLIGSGANGKSVFLNVLSEVFGRDNISNVEMSSLTQDFQTIQLMTSMLNISAETKTEVNGAETRFKQIVTGDEITACYKGKDYIKFKPRAKMFLACNEYMKSNDTTEGWGRRFCFVNFPIRFVEYPTEDDERQIDRNIESKLTTQKMLSGIFNWVLEGYKYLLSVDGEFTETADQVEIMEDFKELSNPLIIFTKEIDFGAYSKLSNSTLYQRYKDWCEDCNHKVMSKTRFSKQFCKIIKEYRKDLKPYRLKYSRGYEIIRSTNND